MARPNFQQDATLAFVVENTGTPVRTVDVAEALNLSQDAARNALTRLHQLRRVHIAAWHRNRRAGGRPAPMYAAGPGTDAERPAPLPRYVPTGNGERPRAVVHLPSTRATWIPHGIAA